MIVRLAGVDGKENPFNPVEVTEVTSSIDPKGVRGGLFGTALSEVSAVAGRKVSSGGPSFTVTLDGVKPASSRSRLVQKEESMGMRRGMRGNHNGGKNRSQGRRAVSANDLDSELESYMAQK